MQDSAAYRSDGILQEHRMSFRSTSLHSYASGPTLKVDLDKVQTWLNAVNKLTQNFDAKKTKYMLIGNRPKLDLVSDCFIHNS